MFHMNDEGYFTVEAALIFPFVLGVILLVMQMWFFKYDRVLQDMDTMSVLVRCRMQRDLNPQEKSEYVISQMQERYKDHYIAWNFGDISVNAGPENVSVTVTGGSRMNPGRLAFWNGGNRFLSVTEMEAATPSEIFVIRNFKKLTEGQDDCL